MSSNPEPSRSLERRLQLALGGLTLAALLGLALAGILAVRQAASEFVVTRLEHDAEAIIAMLDVQQKRLTRATSPIYNQPYSGHYYALRFDDGTLLRSRSLWDWELDVGDINVGGVAVATAEGPQGQRLLVRRAAYRAQQVEFTIALAEDVGPFRAAMQTLLWTALVVVLGTVLLLLWVQKGFLRHAFHKLDLLREDMRRIERGEKLALPTDMPSEIAPLVSDFNRLLVSWRGHLDRSRHAAGNLAHALKTPLSLILQHGKRQGETEVVEQVERMHRLIDRELDRARIAGSAMVGRHFHPHTDVQEVADVIRQLHQEKGIELVAEIDAPERLPLDQEDMLELTGNLLENAAKWADRRVRLELAAGSRVRLLVEDDGPGIDAADGAAILRRGRRLDETTEGHGIGLSIVREILGLYGGTIALDASPELGGLRVTVELPVPGQAVLATGGRH